MGKWMGWDAISFFGRRLRDIRFDYFFKGGILIVTEAGLWARSFLRLEMLCEEEEKCYSRDSKGGREFI